MFGEEPSSQPYEILLRDWTQCEVVMCTQIDDDDDDDVEK